MDDGPNPPAGRVAPAWWGVAAAAMALIASTAIALSGDLAPGEDATFHAVNGAPAIVRLPLQVVQHLGASMSVLAIAAVLTLTRRRRAGVAIVAGWAIARATSTLLKAWVGRGRPPAFFDDVVLRQHLPDDNGFPSAHCANAAALAIIIGWVWPRWRIPAAAIAVAVGLGRMAVGVHLPLDLIGGWALGILAAVAACTLATRFVPTPQEGAVASAPIEGPKSH